MTKRHEFIDKNNIIKEVFKEYGHELPNLPPRPTVPQPPPKDYSFYFVPSEYAGHSSPTQILEYKNVIKTDKTALKPTLESGGWGGLTAGMLDITLGSKSFGVFG